jgi:hypothetical protein
MLNALASSKLMYNINFLVCDFLFEESERKFEKWKKSYQCSFLLPWILPWCRRKCDSAPGGIVIFFFFLSGKYSIMFIYQASLGLSIIGATTTIRITTPSILTLSIKCILMVFTINDTQLNKTVIMLNVVMMSVDRLYVVMLSVVVP